MIDMGKELEFNQKLVKSQEAFVDAIIRECALMMIQKEADARKIEELEERLNALPPSVSNGYALVDNHENSILQQRLNKAIADLHFVMAGGDPCKVCSAKCTFGEKNCKPVWRGEAGDNE